MKKTISKILSITLFVAILLSISSMSAFAQSIYLEDFSTASQENFSDYISQDANDFVTEYYKDMVSYAKEYKISFGLTNDDFSNIRIGEPFFILNLESESQEPIYYYPLLNSDNEFVLLLTVINTNHSWQCSMDNELVDELNLIDYYYIDYVFYKVNDTIIAQNSNDIQYMNSTVYNNPYCVLSYDQIHNILINSISTMKKINVEKNIEIANGLPTIEKYSPAYSSVVSTTDFQEKMLKLYNSKGQGNYGRCWAASVATIANYLNGTNISAAKVCNDMGIGYNAGGSITDKQTALKKYGISYNNTRSRSLSWAEITKNINYKKPVALSCSSSAGWHAVTLVGYRSFKVNQFIAIWDSATNSGAGATKIIYYSGSSTTFQSSTTGPVFTWVYSLSRY